MLPNLLRAVLLKLSWRWLLLQIANRQSKVPQEEASFTFPRAITTDMWLLKVSAAQQTNVNCCRDTSTIKTQTNLSGWRWVGRVGRKRLQLAAFNYPLHSCEPLALAMPVTNCSRTVGHSWVEYILGGKRERERGSGGNYGWHCWNSLYWKNLSVLIYYQWLQRLLMEAFTSWK